MGCQLCEAGTGLFASCTAGALGSIEPKLCALRWDAWLWKLWKSVRRLCTVWNDSVFSVAAVRELYPRGQRALHT